MRYANNPFGPVVDGSISWLKSRVLRWGWLGLLCASEAVVAANLPAALPVKIQALNSFQQHDTAQQDVRLRAVNGSSTVANANTEADNPAQQQAEIWRDYISHFDGLSSDAIRPGSEPRLFRAGPDADHVVILIHGLSDSPYYMEAIGRHLHQTLGVHVLLPLLDGHGLKVPNGMRQVTLERWLANVAFAVDYAASMVATPTESVPAGAARKNSTISIGGLSTGGTLGTYQALNDARINGSVLLFAAALKFPGLRGAMQEAFLRSDWARRMDRWLEGDEAALIGNNPYRYSRIDIGSAMPLAQLMRRIEQQLQTIAKAGEPLLQQSVFIAHSEIDETAAIAGVDRLAAGLPVERVEFVRYKSGDGVRHANVVLAEPIESADGEVLEKANPGFAQMMEIAQRFMAATD